MKINLTPASLLLLALAGCAPVDTPGGGGSYYQCDRGTRLRVDYRGRGAIVRVNDRTMVALRSTPSTRGPVYEGRQGQRLERQGNMVIWNTALRTPPERCSPIVMPRPR